MVIKMERTDLQAETDRIVDTYSDMVYKLAYAQVRNKNDADDIYQEVFLRYVRKKPAFESTPNRWRIISCSSRRRKAI